MSDSVGFKRICRHTTADFIFLVPGSCGVYTFCFSLFVLYAPPVVALPLNCKWDVFEYVGAANI